MIKNLFKNIRNTKYNIELASKFNDLMNAMKKADINNNNGLDDFFKALVIRRNKENIKKFIKIPYKKRIIVLPQCLRNIKKCRAEDKGGYYKCLKCGGCDIKNVIEKSNELNYKEVFIIKGCSAINDIIKKLDLGAVLGVGCIYESAIGVISCERFKVLVQYITLLKDGCVETKVDWDSFYSLMEFREE